MVLSIAEAKAVLKLNCDLGEGLDEVDRQIMPFIDQANIACGGHYGDRKSMQQTVKLAATYDVAIGAHPSYPDREHFGRRSITMPIDSLRMALSEQIQTLCDELNTQKLSLSHIKAHGALYNDSLLKPELLALLLELAQYFKCALMLQSQADNTLSTSLAQKFNVPVIYEGFADRCYQDNGLLVARSQPHAVYHETQKILKQAHNFAQNAAILSESKQALTLKIDSLCVHGDTPNALNAVKAIHHALHKPNS